MDEVIKNFSLFLGILKMSKTKMIQQWDTEAFQRAIKWAKYFEQVFAKLSNRESLKRKFSNYLDQSSISDCDFKSFDDLKDSQEILKCNILQNMLCPLEIFAEVLRYFYVDSSDNCLENGSSATEKSNECVSKMFEVCHSKRLSQNIAKMWLEYQEQHDARKKLKSDFGQTLSDTTLSVDHTTLCDRTIEKGFHTKLKAHLLRTCMLNSIEKNSNATALKGLLGALASTSDGDNILLEAYLQNINAKSQSSSSECCSSNVTDVNQKTVYNILQEHIHDNLLKAWRKDVRRFLHFPVLTLVEIATSSSQFAELYFEVLSHCCAVYDEEFWMDEFSIVQSLESNRRAVERAAWQKKLMQHFKEICMGDVMEEADVIHLETFGKNLQDSGCKGSLFESTWDEMKRSVLNSN